LPSWEETRQLGGESKKHIILNWFHSEGNASNGPVEGLILKTKLAMRKMVGFWKEKILQIALYHTLRNLSEPEISHKFC
jgi:transposase